jgi:uncharacterized membrane protein
MRDFWKKIRFDPFGRAFTEIAVTVIFTFLPILLFSIPIIAGGDEISAETVGSNFWSYWNSGELVLPLLGLCGTVVALISLNSSLLPGWLRTTGLILALIISAGGGYLLGTNRGFGNILLSEVVVATFVVYLVVILLWFGLSVKVNHGPESVSDAEDRVGDLLKEKQRREAGSQ